MTDLERIKKDVVEMDSRANVRWYDTKVLTKAVRLILEELTADRKTENSSEKPNNCEDLQDWKDKMWAEAIVTEPTTEDCSTVEPQTCSVNGRPYDCGNCEYHKCTADEPQTETQMKTQNSNLAFEKDECAKEYEELGLKELKELIKADRKTEPQRGCDADCHEDCAECAKETELWKAEQTEPSNSEIPNNCEHITEDGVTCAKYPACDDCLDNPLNKVKGSERLLKGSEQTDLVEDSPSLVKDLVKAFGEDGTWLERQGVYTLTLAEAKQRAVDIIESVLAKDEPQTCDDCIWSVCNYNKAFEDEPTISKMEQVEDETRLTAKCLNCANGSSYKCSKCDGEMYYKYDKDEPQIFICPIQNDCEALIEDEPQTDCAWK